jgi:hypothetical protein
MGNNNIFGHDVKQLSKAGEKVGPVEDRFSFSVYICKSITQLIGDYYFETSRRYLLR